MSGLDDQELNYHVQAGKIGELQHQLVELITMPRTPAEVNELLTKINNTIHPHMDEWAVWNGVLWFVKRHRNGCDETREFGGVLRCKHRYDQKVDAHTATWVLAYLRELRDGVIENE